MQPSSQSSFGDVLKQWRIAAGLTQEDSAARAGLSVRAIAYLERGTRKPYADTVRRLSEALDLAPTHPPAIVQDVPLSNLTNVPVPLSSFVGRIEEREKLKHLLVRSPSEGGSRLLTLTGAGGCGKTRLALALAQDVLEEYPDGVWFVSMAALPASSQPDVQLVAAALGNTLKVQEQPGRPIVTTLREFLSTQRILLVLDNCEHLLAANAMLAVILLPTCPSLTMLATSRQRLGITGETVWQVRPLSSPPAGAHRDAVFDEASLLELRRYETVQLFEQRLHAQRSIFSLTAANAVAVTMICSHVDGLPLAVELAAARAGVLGLDTLVTKLSTRLLLLASSDLTAPLRQHTLHATVDWSYALLSAAEQALLMRLAVFAGGFSFEAAEWLVHTESSHLVDRDDVPDLLADLVGKSLVTFDESQAAVRYRMLEMVRQYAHAQLTAAGLLLETQRLHLAWCLDLAHRARDALSGPHHSVWLCRLSLEHDNLRAALHWSVREGGDPAAGMRLATMLWPFWDHRGFWSEGRAWLEAAIAAYPDAPETLRAGALIGAGMLAFRQAANVEAAMLLDTAIDVCRRSGDRTGLAAALGSRGSMAEAQSDLEKAVELFSESLGIYQELGDQRGIAQMTMDRAIIAQCYSEYDKAADLYCECLSVYRALGDQAGVARALTSLGSIARAHSEYEQARVYHEQALSMFEPLGDRRGVANTLGSLGSIAEIQGNYEQMVELFEHSLAIHRELGNQRGIADVMASLGIAAFHLNDDARAQELLKEALALRTSRADAPGAPHILSALGDIACAHGATEEAGSRYAESLAAWRQCGHRWGIARALERLGSLALLQGEATLAGKRFWESLALQRALGHRLGMVECWEGLALVAATAGHVERTVRWLSATEAARNLLGAPIPPRRQPTFQQTMNIARDQLGERLFCLAWEAGKELILEDLSGTVDETSESAVGEGEYMEH